MMIGYARVSTPDQDLRTQRDALLEVGCASLYQETVSGSLRDRPELARCLESLQEGDTLVVVALDRLGRSVRHLVDVLDLLRTRKVNLRSLREAIDTQTPVGGLIFHIFAAVGEFERDLTRERTVKALASARARGRKGGRPPVVAGKRLILARELWESRKYTLKAIAQLLGVSESSVYRALKRQAGV
jgi:DNA invertase Pin-like site-specific DNA recombinase